MSFVPILVALGTSCAFELKRAAASKGPALAPDVAQLKASEARLKKLMTVRDSSDYLCDRERSAGEGARPRLARQPRGVRPPRCARAFSRALF